jgi:hypothetical protein
MPNQYTGPRPVIDRLMCSFVVVDSGCWIWVGPRDGNGYGSITIASRNRLAHRVAYEVFVGPIPDGLTIDHLCRERSCINVRHMEPVTRGENVLRGIGPAAENARKTTCYKCGGALAVRAGKRQCWPCIKQYNAEKYRKARSEGRR